MCTTFACVAAFENEKTKGMIFTRLAASGGAVIQELLTPRVIIHQAVGDAKLEHGEADPARMYKPD